MANNIFKKKDVKLDTFEDLNCKGVIASFSQGDRISDKLVFRLTNDGVPLDLTDVVQVRIDFRKPDGKLVFQYCTIEDRPQGLVSCILTTQTLAAPGKVYAEVTAKYPEGKDAVTRQFTFHVEEAIAGDKSIQSQNEWPMLERAIVAGDMLAGVDLVAIIKAGELAAAALPTTGGTMTGQVVSDVSTTARGYGWKGGITDLGLIADKDGFWRLRNYAKGKDVFSYNAATEQMYFNADSNLVKKSGDTMTGDLNFGGATARQITAAAGTGKIVFGGSGLWIEDSNGGNIPWQYRYSDKQFVVNADTNLLKTTGGTMSGVLNVSGTNARMEIDDKAGSIRVHQPTDATTSARGMQFYEGGTTVGGFGRLRNGSTTDQLYMGWGANPWDSNTSLTVSNSQFTYKNKPVAMRDKDGQTTLTLTAEATNVNSGYMPLAERRGNTVTFRMEITRNANSTSPVVCTLPVDLRPPITLSQYFTANDGTAVGVNVIWDGKVEVYTTGKPVKIVFTYIAN